MDNLSTVSLPDFVKLAKVLWDKGAEQYPAVMRRSGLVREVPIPQNTGDTREFSEIDLEQYASRKGEREQATFAKIQQGYSKTGKTYRIAFAEAITWEMRTQGKYPEVTAKLTNLLPTAINRMELDLQHRFTFGTVTSYVDRDGVTIDVTVGDGLSLFNTAHLVRGSATTFRNRLANNPAFSRSALESMEKMRIENRINQFGQKVPVRDDTIWTTDDPNTVNSVRILLRSTASVEDEKNSGVFNDYRAKYKHVALPRVATDAQGNADSTKAKYWGLASSLDTTFYLGVHEEPHVIPPSANGAQDVLTDDWYFNVRANYMIVIPSASWVGFSSGDGNA